MSRNGRKRSGAALLWALVVLAVLGVTLATAASQFTAARRGLDQRSNRLQTVWLARAGCELAAARLLADATGYAGETVAPIADAEVKITVEKNATKADTYRVRCEASYPVGQRGTVLRVVTRTVTRRTDAGTTRVELASTDDAD
jgi:type II secretory pathway component PulK